MKKNEPVSRRKKGRPLSFNRDEALHQAMLLFWQHGYESTSLHDLTTALGVTPSSIYTVFGDKKRLFLAAVGHYLSGPVTSETIIEESATARDAAWGLLQAAAIGFTGEDTPLGCLLASSAISGSDCGCRSPRGAGCHAARHRSESATQDNASNGCWRDACDDGCGSSCRAHHRCYPGDVHVSAGWSAA